MIPAVSDQQDTGDVAGAGGVRAQRPGEVPWDHYVHEILVEEAGALRTAVVGRNVERGGESVRFWAVVAVAAFLVGVVAMTGSRPWLPISWTAWVVAVVAVGFAVVRRSAGADRVQAWVLAFVDREQGEVRVREGPEDESALTGRSIAFEDVVEVVYALREVPLPGRGRQPRLLGAGVYLRTVDGLISPVVGSTHAREAAFAAASALALRIGVGVKQVGVGWGSGR